MTSKKRLYALQMKIRFNFEDNLKNIEFLSASCGEGAIILTPEVALSGFCYQRMNDASEFSKLATERLIKASEDKTIITTMIENYNGKYFNNLKVFSYGVMIHKQSKTKLFPLGGEHNHFTNGDESEFCMFSVDNIKCAAINCFELRFPKIWDIVRGADIIFVPAQWGKERKEHWETLNRALAIVNQAFVVCADCANDTMAKGSAIISPFGVVIKNDNREVISAEVDLSEISKTRKYIDVGLS
ncbi:nitrilase-related carbon-nitrogen hydrolase [Helicobacter sp. MIT 14-3879]|uniref:nitrilase-related carbon-nitrogen hydrolase n=1 Tax=Helicobacter sp. MIT 14-3879 TaxID=2040649 RepID=UPI000E1F472A|nr:nitrilase-related carbon-nitrogen hydrolase [Helicobacter sp. MIT 14-3879]RDU63963.1 carbon-nitrogen hydrolase family protein [Helicobacter sp. MIT 14-3879]